MATFNEIKVAESQLQERSGYSMNGLLRFIDVPQLLREYIAVIHYGAPQGSSHLIMALFSEEYGEKLARGLERLISAHTLPEDAQGSALEKAALISRSWKSAARQFNDEWEEWDVENREAWHRSALVNEYRFSCKEEFKGNCTLLPFILDERPPIRRGTTLEEMRYAGKYIYPTTRALTLEAMGYKEPEGTVEHKRMELTFSMSAFCQIAVAENPALKEAYDTWNEAFRAASQEFMETKTRGPFLEDLWNAAPQVSVEGISSMLTKVKEGASPEAAVRETAWDEPSIIDMIQHIMDTSPWV